MYFPTSNITNPTTMNGIVSFTLFIFILLVRRDSYANILVFVQYDRNYFDSVRRGFRIQKNVKEVIFIEKGGKSGMEPIF
jgi:hypothetical protein